MARFPRRFLLAAALLAPPDQSARQTPSTYQPRALAPIRWPDNATGPQDRGMNFTEVPLYLGSSRLTLVRKETGWGTCVLVEGFAVYDVDKNRLHRARTHDDTVAAWHQVWDALSYEMDCTRAFATGNDSTNGTVYWIAGCLFVADDSLLAYGVVSDTNPEAKTYVDSLLKRAGYYRYNVHNRTVTKVASLGSGFAKSCKEDVHRQKRDQAP